MGKFISKFEMKPELREKIKEYSLNINSIEQFYLRFPAKLRELTDSKTRNMNPKQKQDKLNQRPNNLPEETDIKLFAQAIEFDKIHHSDVYIFSNDGDFTEFIDEIPSEFKIKILRIEDIIPSYATE